MQKHSLAVALALFVGVAGCSGAATSEIGDGSASSGKDANAEREGKVVTSKAASADFGSTDPVVGVWVLPSPGGGAYSFTLHANGDMARGLPDGSGKIVSPCAEEDRPAALRGVADDGEATKCGGWRRDGDAVVIHWAGLPKEPYRCALNGETLRCDDDEYLKGRSAQGVTLAGTFKLDWSSTGGYSPPGQTTSVNLSRQITFDGDRFEATKWTGLTTTYEPSLTGRQGAEGAAQDGQVRASYRFESFTLETTLDDGTTDRGRAYVVFQEGRLAMLYVQGYGHLQPEP